MGRFEVRVEEEFDAAHFIKEIGGKCEKVHGHRFRVAIVVGRDELDGRGIAVDFRELKAILREIIDEIDHPLLNEHPFFEGRSPSSENIALFIHERAKGRIEGILRIEVWESPQSCVTFYP